MKKIELLAPAGNLERLKFALAYGADAVYIGGQKYSLRARASNFTIEDIKEAVKEAKKYNAKIYVTCNIFALNEDLLDLKDLENFKAGDILVVKDTSNEMMAQIRQASGLIVEANDMNCHAAIVGLSLDIPVLIGAENALEILKSSAYVELDAENGLVSAN